MYPHGRQFIYLLALFVGPTAIASAQSAGKGCQDAIWLRDNVLARNYTQALNRYELTTTLIADEQQIRRDLGVNLAFNGSDGRLAFGQFAGAIKLHTDFLNNVLSLTPSGAAAGRASRVLQAIEMYEAGEAGLNDDPLGLLVAVAAHEGGQAGGALKTYYDFYDGVKRIADLAPQRANYVRAAEDQLTRADTAIAQAQRTRSAMGLRLQAMQDTKQGIDSYLLAHCASSLRGEWRGTLVGSVAQLGPIPVTNLTLDSFLSVSGDSPPLQGQIRIDIGGGQTHSGHLSGISESSDGSFTASTDNNLRISGKMSADRRSFTGTLTGTVVNGGSQAWAMRFRRVP